MLSEVVPDIKCYPGAGTGDMDMWFQLGREKQKSHKFKTRLSQGIRQFLGVKNKKVGIAQWCSICLVLVRPWVWSLLHFHKKSSRSQGGPLCPVWSGIPVSGRRSGICYFCVSTGSESFPLSQCLEGGVVWNGEPVTKVRCVLVLPLNTLRRLRIGYL